MHIYMYCSGLAVIIAVDGLDVCEELRSKWMDPGMSFVVARAEIIEI